MIQHQIKGREQQRLLDAEKKDQETQAMLKYLERLQEEDMENLHKKRQSQKQLMEEVAQSNEVGLERGGGRGRGRGEGGTELWKEGSGGGGGVGGERESISLVLRLPDRFQLLYVLKKIKEPGDEANSESTSTCNGMKKQGE